MLKAIKSKKILAILLALAIVVSLFSFYSTNVMAQPTLEESALTSSDVPEFEYSSGTKFTMADGSVNISGEANGWASVKYETGAVPVINMKPVLEDNGEAYVAVTPDSITSTGSVVYGADTKGLILKLVRTGTTLGVYYWNGADFTTQCASVADYDFDTAAAFKWVLVDKSHKYALSVNSVAQEDYNVSEKIYELDDENYFTFFGAADTTFKFDNVLVKSNETDDVFTELNDSSNNVAITGDETNGYTFTAEKGCAYFATTNKAYDFNSTEISFNISDTAGTYTSGDTIGKVGFVISSHAAIRSYNNYTTYNVPTTNDATGDSLFISFNRYHTASAEYVLLGVRGHNGAYNFGQYKINSQLDLNNDITIGFIKENGKWYLTVNGKTHTALLNSQEYPNMLDNFVSKLAGNKVFYSVYTSGAFPLKNVKFSNKAELPALTSNGADATSSGDDTTGYASTSVAAHKTLNFTKPIDLNTQGFKFNIGLTNALGSNMWYKVMITDSPYNPLSANAGAGNDNYESANELHLSFMEFTNNTGTAIQLRIGVRPGNVGVGSTKYFKYWLNIDYSAAHTYQFVKSGENWNLLVDGNAGTNDANYSDVQPIINTMLNKLVSGKSYVHFQGNEAITYSDINVYDINPITSTSPLLTSGATTEYTGNETDGYGFTNTATGGAAKLTKAMNLATSDISFVQTTHGNGSLVVSFSSTPNMIGGAPWHTKNDQINNNLILFGIYSPAADNSNIVIRLRCFKDSGAVYWKDGWATVRLGDKSVPHTYGFKQDTDGNWKITVDGTIVNSTYDSDYQAVLNTNIPKLIETGAYAQLCYDGVALGFTNLKPVDKTGVDSFALDKETYVKRTLTTLKLNKKSSAAVAANIYSNNVCIYSDDIDADGLELAIASNDQELYAKYVFANGQTEITRIYSAGDVNERGSIDICSLVAMDQQTSATYNSEIDGVDGFDSASETAALRNLLLGIE